MNIDTSKIKNTLRTLRHKNPALFRAVQKKICQIASLDEIFLNHFKNLRHDLSHLKRVQIGSFVLTFRLKGDIIIFEDLDHHDKIYNRKR